MTVAGGEDQRIIQIRTEGKIDRLGDKVDRFQADVIDIRGRVDRHASDLMDMRGHMIAHANHPERLNALETHKTLLEGERKGVAISTKVIWIGITAIGAGLLGIMALIFKVFGGAV